MIFSLIHLFLSLSAANPFPYLARDPLRLQEKTARRSSTVVPIFNTSGVASQNESSYTSLNDISCYIPTPAIQPTITTIQDCFIIFREIRNLPHFHTVQRFLEDVAPKLEHMYPASGTPPYLLVKDTPTGGNCAIMLSAIHPDAPDEFSWQQVQNTGRAIMESCGSPGYGGRSSIGRYHSWLVKVYGYNERAFLAEKEGYTKTKASLDLLN